MRKIILIFIVAFLTACTSAEKEMDVIQQIEKDLDKIVSSSQNSNWPKEPEDFYTEYKTEFDNIIAEKQIVLSHFVNKFNQSRADGIEQYAMAVALSKIVEDQINVNDWTTGKEWFEKYMEIKEK